MEEVGDFDPTDDVHLFVLHLVFKPRINISLEQFIGSWNINPMHTECNWSPKKMCMNAVLDPVNRGLTAVRDIHDPVPDDVQGVGIDEDGHLPLQDLDADTVEISITNISVTSLQLDVNNTDNATRKAL